MEFMTKFKTDFTTVHLPLSMTIASRFETFVVTFSDSVSIALESLTFVADNVDDPLQQNLFLLRSQFVIRNFMKSYYVP